MKFVSVASFHRGLALETKGLIINALFTLETKFKITILAIFDDFSICLFWHKPLT